MVNLKQQKQINMNSNWKTLGVLALAVVFFASCGGKLKTSPSVDSNASQHNQDVSNTTTESNNVNTDINTAMVNNSVFGKNFSVQSSPTICGATIDTTGETATQPYITINYNGSTTCSATEIRTGQIKVQLISGSHWSDAGSVLEVTFINYKVVYPTLNSHSLTFNGIKYLTDVSGIDYLTYYLSGSATIQTRERSYNMLVTFDNGQTSSWNSARLTTWAATNYTQFSGTVNGDTTIGGKIIDSWGKTRFNTNFTTQMIQPWVSNSTCGWWCPTSGNYTSATDSFTVTALLGVNSSGTQVNSGCAYGFKLDWTLISSGNNYNGEAIIQYW